MSFESILLWRSPRICIGICLGRVHLKTIWMVGWALCPSPIRGWYWAFCVPMFLSGLVHFCPWNHPTLFCKQGFAIPMSYIFVLRDTDQTISLHEYAVHCCQALIFCSMSGTIFLPRSTVSLLLSFTLNQASATTSHSRMPSRRNGKFTCLGFVRGCLVGLALLIRFLVLWFVERIIIKMFTELLRSFPSISCPSCSRYPIPTSTEFFYVMHMVLLAKFPWLIFLWQNVSGILLKYPPFFLFFEKYASSDLWEIATCLSKLLWIMVWFHCHCPFCTPSLKTVHPYSWTWLEMVHQSIFHLDLSSFNLRLTGYSPSRFDSMILSSIFESLKRLSL